MDAVILKGWLRFSTNIKIRGHSYSLREKRGAGVFHDLTEPNQEVADEH